MEKAQGSHTAPDRVLLYHGTSEGHVAAILRGGFLSPAQLAMDSVRQVVADYLPGHPVDDTMVSDVMRSGSRIQSRSDESNGGNTLFATPDAALAMEYAAQHAAHGGEFGYGVHQALVSLGHHGLPPRFDGARPVMLTLSIPAADLHLEKGMTVKTSAGSLGTVETSHEVFVNDTSRADIMAVRFARAAERGWTFDGEPDLSPQQALAAVAPSFADARPRAAPPDALVQHIADTVYGFRRLPDACIEHVRRKPVAAAMMYNAEGALEKILIPDPDFEPAAQKLAGEGFRNVAQSYKLPGSLSPREMDGYLNALAAGMQHGHMTETEKARAERRLFERIVADNPEAAPLQAAVKTQAGVTAALRGISHGMTAADIEFSLSHPAAGRDADYLAQKKTAGFALAWNPAPSTIDSIRAQMAQKLAAFEASSRTPSSAPAQPV